MEWGSEHNLHERYNLLSHDFLPSQYTTHCDVKMQTFQMCLKCMPRLPLNWLSVLIYEILINIKVDKGVKDTDLMLWLKQTWRCNRGQSVYRAVTGSDWTKRFREYHGIGGPFWERIASGVLTVSNMKLFWNFHVWPLNWGEHIHDCDWVFLGIHAHVALTECNLHVLLEGKEN